MNPRRLYRLPAVHRRLRRFQYAVGYDYRNSHRMHSVWVAISLVEIELNDSGTLTGVIAPTLGAIYGAFAPALPKGPDRFLSLLASAASPCALVSLGAFIADVRSRPKWGEISDMVLLKLLGQPALTWLLARFVFHLPPLLTGVAVVVAALPTGTGPYMLANIYRRDAAAIAGSIFVSTVLSVVSIAVLVALFTA
jgi:malonate transporter and related proteins